MKKVILFLILSILSFSIQAQKNEISLSYGVPSFEGAFLDFENYVMKDSYSKNLGIIGIAYGHYSDSEKWRFGVNVDYEIFERDGKVSGNYCLKILPKVDYFWTKKERNFRFYSGIAVGLSFEHMVAYNRSKQYKDDKTVFAPNLTYLGMRYGKDWSVFAEFNAPFRSIFNIGVSKRF